MAFAKTERELWTPGCGRPHPDIELIMEWASGKHAHIVCERPLLCPVDQIFPTWNCQTSKFYAEGSDAAQAAKKGYVHKYVLPTVAPRLPSFNQVRRETPPPAQQRLDLS